MARSVCNHVSLTPYRQKFDPFMFDSRICRCSSAHILFRIRAHYVHLLFELKIKTTLYSFLIWLNFDLCRKKWRTTLWLSLCTVKLFWFSPNAKLKCSTFARFDLPGIQKLYFLVCEINVRVLFTRHANDVHCLLSREGIQYPTCSALHSSVFTMVNFYWPGKLKTGIPVGATRHSPRIAKSLLVKS